MGCVAFAVVGDYWLAALCLANVAILGFTIIPPLVQTRKDERIVLAVVKRLGADASAGRIDEALEEYCERYGVYEVERLESLRAAMQRLDAKGIASGRAAALGSSHREG